MIGIISAMPEEVQCLLNALQNIQTDTKGMRTYYSGLLFTKKVVIVFSRWGKVAAATTTTQLINDYQVDEIIFTGVAGAIHSNLNIGDIVIGQKLIQHDLNAAPFYDQFHIPILNIKSISTNNRDAISIATRSFLSNYNKYVEPKEAVNFNIYHPKSIMGDIASGDQFISSKEKIKELNKSLPTVVCVEMEGAAVAQVCHEYNMPFLIIRTISDKANDTAHIDFDRFVNSIASKYALGILENYFA